MLVRMRHKQVFSTLAEGGEQQKEDVMYHLTVDADMCLLHILPDVTVLAEVELQSPVITSLPYLHCMAKQIMCLLDVIFPRWFSCQESKSRKTRQLQLFIWPKCDICRYTRQGSTEHFSSLLAPGTHRGSLMWYKKFPAWVLCLACCGKSTHP